MQPADLPSALPTPRQILTSLINTLRKPDETAVSSTSASASTGTTVLGTSHPTTRRPASSVPPALGYGRENLYPYPYPSYITSAAQRQRKQQNPFRVLPPVKRKLLMTLYLIYPSITLPALDLLDRGLVELLYLQLPHSPSVSDQEAGGSGEFKGSVESGRYRNQEESPTSNKNRSDHSGTEPAGAGAGAGARASISHNEEEAQPEPQVYIVRSARPSPGGAGGGRKFPKRDSTSGTSYGGAGAAAAAAGGGGGGGGKRYVVRTRAWHCSCAAFAFSAFPPITARKPLEGTLGADGAVDAPMMDSEADISEEEPDEIERRHAQAKGRMLDPSECQNLGLCEDDDNLDGTEDGPEQEGEKEKEKEKAGDNKWSFGALSLDGTPHRGVKGLPPGVPCCKHLLACVLAERWPEVLGTYVKRRDVGKPEMAGLVAEL
ncbi:hypothetical protein MKZ38_002361 [Zalerion maritima]|uniref:SWIM-type domain-containing protein n=1 Tax=Zalerion maritima TaxID=339359 RepID=A0AAD5RZB2_9PEZI|nr:hypothetical protein MKZ38_002361 [Zalerion maritima]